MISFVRKLDRLYAMSERDNLLHHPRCNEETTLSSLLKSFHSEFALFDDKMKALANEDKPFSLKTIGEYFKILRSADQAIAKMVTGKNEEKQISSYLKYSVLFMGLLNSISSCFFHLGEARLRLVNGLSLLESSPADALKWMKPITLKHVEEESDDVVEEDGISDGFGEVGLVWFWACYTLLGALSFDSIKWVKKRRKVRLMSDFGFKDHRWEVKEIVEINEAVIELRSKVEEGRASRDESNIVRRKVEVFGSGFDILQKDVDKLFFSVLGVRDRLLYDMRLSLDTQH